MFIFGLTIGLVISAAIMRKKISEKEKTVLELQLSVEHERALSREKILSLEQAQAKMSDTFKSLSADALALNNKSFMQLAQATFEKFQAGAQHDFKASQQALTEMMNPIKQALTGVDVKIGELEKARVGAYEVLRHQVGDLVKSQKELRQETANLVKALRAPNVRGRWGEMQLKRVVELAGLSNHCDFIEQANLNVDDGRLRPDMIVRLPGEKHIVIDAKAPLSSYLDALEATEDSVKTEHLQNHARQVRAHITALSSRAYWDNLPLNTSPEFVVLFLPGETFFSAALEYDPELIELGVEKKVIITTPSTLIAMLHAVAYGWKQESIAANAQEISELGRDLYKRISDMGKHMSKLGRDLHQAVNSYNSTVGSLELRVLPSARKFKELETTSSRVEIESLSQIEHVPRDLQAAEIAQTISVCR